MRLQLYIILVQNCTVAEVDLNLRFHHLSSLSRLSCCVLYFAVLVQHPNLEVKFLRLQKQCTDQGRMNKLMLLQHYETLVLQSSYLALGQG